MASVTRLCDSVKIKRVHENKNVCICVSVSGEEWGGGGGYRGFVSAQNSKLSDRLKELIEFCCLQPGHRDSNCLTNAVYF